MTLSVGRMELWSRLGRITVAEAMVDRAAEYVAERQWRDRHLDAPHGQSWFTSMHACLAGDTEVVTRQGIKPIRELVGDAELLMPALNEADGQSRAGRGQQKRAYRRGSFQSVPVFSFGEQETYEVHLRRGRQTKVVKATRNHRWYLKDTRILTTTQLATGMKLKGVKARLTVRVRMVPFAVAQGFVFGDGTARRAHRHVAWLDLHHNGKDEAMLEFFRGHETVDIHREGRLRVTQIQSLPRTWKELPNFNESSAFLISWLAGYFAADGSVSKSGQATLCSASREAIDCARGVLSICGVGYGPVKVSVQSGTYPHGATYENKVMYSISINVRELPSWFFVLPKHAERAAARIAKPKGYAHEWEVADVAHGSFEEVFCPTTPSECFALSDELLTGNSRFPGGDPRPCPRALAYELMAFATAEPMPQRVPAAGIVGVAIEDWLVSMLGYDGRVLSASVDAQHQIGFEDADHWLTGSPDLVVLPPGWNRPLVIECKSEKIERVEEMRALTRSYRPAHGRQCCGYVGMGHHISPMLWPKAVVCERTWRLAVHDSEFDFNGEALVCRDHDTTGCLIEIDLEPIRDGVVLYCARDNPEVRASWYFEHDEQWFQSGLETLRRAQEHYASDLIPAHPFGGKQWSAEPCKFCAHKRNTCKPDLQAGVTKLSESHGVEWSRGVYGHYDPNLIRQQVLDRWRGREGYGYHLPPGYEIGRYGVQKEREHVTHA